MFSCRFALEESGDSSRINRLLLKQEQVMRSPGSKDAQGPHHPETTTVAAADADTQVTVRLNTRR